MQGLALACQLEDKRRSQDGCACLLCAVSWTLDTVILWGYVDCGLCIWYSRGEEPIQGKSRGDSSGMISVWGLLNHRRFPRQI